MNTIAVKFARWDVQPLDNLKASRVYVLREKLNAGLKPSREEKDWITEKVNHNSYFKSAIPLGGYRFDFSDVLRTFVVKQYDSYHEYKAVDKTSLRKMLFGRIQRIIEI